MNNRRNFLKTLGIGICVSSVPIIGFSKENKTGRFLIYNFSVINHPIENSYKPRGRKDLSKIRSLMNIIKKKKNIKSSFSPASTHLLPKKRNEKFASYIIFRPETFRNDNIRVDNKNRWAGCWYYNKKIARNFAVIHFSSYDEIRDYYYSGDLMKDRTNKNGWKEILYVWNIDTEVLIPLVEVL